MLVLNCKRGLQNYLSFCLFERGFFLKKFTWFYFVILLLFGGLEVVWAFSSPFFFFPFCFLFSYQEIGKPNVLIAWFLPNRGMGSAVPRVT